MSTLSNAITELEARRSSLNMEHETIMQRLRAVKAALAGGDEAAAAPVAVKARAKKRRGRKAKSAKAAAPAVKVAKASNATKAAKSTKVAKKAGKTAGKTASKGASRRWFAPGEVNELMKKLITKPTRQTDVIKQLAAAKGYDKLPKKEKMRFTWAVLSAMKAAVKTKRLVKSADGKVVAR